MPRTLLLLLTTALSARALEPGELILIVNKNMPASRQLADHYARVRQVPAENIVELDLPREEDISRRDYDEKLVAPLRQALKERKDRVRCLVCMHGVPLRVGGSSPTAAEREELKTLEPLLQEANNAIQRADAEIKKLDGQTGWLATGPALRSAWQAERSRQERSREPLTRKRAFLTHAESQAAVDSELMLLWWEGYELRRWQINLLHFQVPESQRTGKPPVLLACRIDGPTPEIVKRMIDDAVATQKTGLQGKVYVDARGIRFDPRGPDTGHGYGGYDESMREMAALLKDSGKMDVILDDRNELFVPDSCPEAALYCGWYSHANFIPCCKFVRGAVAWHLASSEAVSLRRKDARYWCKNLLETGACATIGPVAEPYTIGFPKPAEFFGFLATGKYTLAECYGKTVLFASWMGTLIGDPLYNPYEQNPRVPVEDVKPSPREGRSPFAKK